MTEEKPAEPAAPNPPSPATAPVAEPAGSPNLPPNRAAFWAHFQEWAAVRAKPKKIQYVKPHIEPTRYSKRGPMSSADWERFGQWVADRGRPKQYPQLPEVKRMKFPISQLLKRIKELAKPRRITPRYKLKKRKRPKFRCFGPVNMKHIAKLARPRTCGRCPEVILEVKPIPRSALTYVPTPRLINLSRPMTLPRPQHCEYIPKQEEELQKRKKMTHHQMISHLIRLEYLAAPVYRPSPESDEEIQLSRQKKPLKELMPRIEVLSQPRPDFAPKPVKRQHMPLSSLEGRMNELAKPRKFKEYKGDPFEVKKAALTAKTTPRIEELAKPKPDYSQQDEPKKKSRRVR